MVIKVYVSRCSGSTEIKKKQEYILQVLEARKIQFEEIDISDFTQEGPKKFMRENSIPKDGKDVPLPPQVFNEVDYCGDYVAVFEAIEMEELYEFLKLAPEKNVSDAHISMSRGANEEPEEEPPQEEE